MIRSMSHGKRWWRVSSKLSLTTRFACARTSFSTNFWWSLFLLFDWIHPSIDQSVHMQTLTTWHQRPCTWTRQAPWIWVVRFFCRSHLQEMFLSKVFDSVYTKNHIDDGLIGCRLTSICHEGTSNFLYSWLQPLRPASWTCPLRPASCLSME